MNIHHVRKCQLSSLGKAERPAVSPSRCIQLEYEYVQALQYAMQLLIFNLMVTIGFMGEHTLL